MAAPNIVAVATITGKTAANTPPSTSATSLVSNAASSGQVFKINTVTASNLGTSAINATVAYNNAAAGAGTSFPIANTVSIPAGATLIVVDKSTAFYLEENTSLTVTSASASNVAFVASYEIIA